ncbi:hypothetical protein [Nitrosospira briensis]|uniref:hypothetical protein n=1 Tax=Nitrosospira briensis TaxID=35799 RepID=UPI0012E18F5A|nr:hypothetical protein [Nitrosospira briensis]
MGPPEIGGVLMANFRARRFAIVGHGSEAGKIHSGANRYAVPYGQYSRSFSSQKNIVPLQKSANNKR